MKEKILAYLKDKIGSHAGGVQETFLLGIADKFSKTITEEGKIAEVLNDSVLESFKSVYDFHVSETGRKITDATKTSLKTFQEKHGLDENGQPIKKDDPPPKDKDTKDNKDAPVWFQEYRKQQEERITALQSKLDQSEKEKTKATLLGKVKDGLKDKGVPLSFLGKVAERNLNVEKEDDIPVLIAEIETDWNSFKQSSAEDGVFVAIPPAATGTAGKEGEAKAKEIAERRNTSTSEGVKAKKL